MSARDEFFDRGEAMQLLMAAMFGASRVQASLPIPAILRPRPLWSGKQLLSATLPDELTLLLQEDDDEEKKPSFSLRDDGFVFIRGHLLAGRLNKRVVGVSNGSLHHLVALDSRTAVIERNARLHALFDALPAMAHASLMLRGFSVGIGDMTLDDVEARRRIAHEHDMVEKATTKAIGAISFLCSDHVILHSRIIPLFKAPVEKIFVEFLCFSQIIRGYLKMTYTWHDTPCV